MSTDPIYPPRMSLSELQAFLEKVKFWHKNERHLVHTIFDSEAKMYIRDHGYDFVSERDPRTKQTYYKVVKK